MEGKERREEGGREGCEETEGEDSDKIGSYQ